jgi:hypothetical protein
MDILFHVNREPYSKRYHQNIFLHFGYQRLENYHLNIRNCLKQGLSRLKLY